MQKAVVVTFSSLLILLIAVMWLLYEYADESMPKRLNSKEGEYLASPTLLKDVSPWAKKMAESNQTLVYLPPVEEFYLELKLPLENTKHKSKKKKKSIYKLVIEKSDRYSLFCIIQLLHNLKASYVTIDDKKVPKIYIKSKNRVRLEGLVKALKQYSIDSKIVKM